MSSGFVTEAEVNEARRVRQEEWEKVRKPDQPEGRKSKYKIEFISSSSCRKSIHFQRLLKCPTMVGVCMND